MSAHDGVELIDATIADMGNSRLFDGRPWTASEYKLELLAIREAITRDADWSEMQESNLRTHLAAAEARADAAVAEAAEEQATHERAEAKLSAELERARSLAVLLEQEVAALTIGGGRRVL